MGEKFYLEFLSDNYGKKLIDEPIDYDKCDFNLSQEDKRYARDISFSGGDFMLNFVKWREHELEKLLYYHSTFGFESKVNLIIEFSEENEIIIGQLDFKEAKTDGLTYFKCKVVQDSKQALIKRRDDIKVNLLSNETLDGEYIEPLVPENILLKAKPILQSSQWKQVSNFYYNNDAVGDKITVLYAFNPAINLTVYDIKNSFTFFSQREFFGGFPSNEENEFEKIVKSNFRIINANENLRDIRIDVSKFFFNVDTDVDNGGSGYVSGGFFASWGQSLSDAQTHTFFNYQISENSNFNIENSYVLEIPYLNRGESVWLYFYQKVRQSREIPLVTPRFEAFTSINGDMVVDVQVTSVAYNTISPSLRLYDVMKYVAKSIAGINIDAPRFQSGGEFYDQRLISGNFLRGITDKGFYITLKNLRDSLPEINADSEIDYYSKLFFGLEDDFYKNEEIAFFSSSQFDSLEKGFNPRFAINQFNYKYKSYQSQKENTKENSYDVVHGESQWALSNKMVENKKEIDIEWVRDAFEIEVNRQNGLDKSNNTATQDDDKLFCIDTIDITNEEDRVQKETEFLYHSYSTITGYNTISNDGTLNFQLLGIVAGDLLSITSNPNFGNYQVIESNTNNLILQRLSSGVASVTGQYITEFNYTISSDTASYTNRTNEGFTLINNLNNGEKYANLRFSKKRNIVNYWSKYLATCNLYHKEQGIKNTFYKNNPDALTVYEGSQIKEGEAFIPENPILSPVLYENVTLLCDKETFFNIQKDVRTKRGYFRFIDNTGTVIKGYPKNMKYMISESALVCDLEEKFESSNLTIDTSTIGIILINNETRVYDFNYKFLDKKLYIYDSNDELLYNPVYWNKVTINGALASSENELKSWLELI